MTDHHTATATLEPHGSGRLLTVTDLSVAFPTPIGLARAVSNVSFTLDRGEVLGIVGESGSGKSLTAMSIIDLLASTAQRTGSILVDGVEATEMTTKQLRRLRGGTVGTIFQDPLSSLNPVMTIGSQLVEAIRTQTPDISKAEARAHGADLLDRVGIKNARERLKVYPHELSGGMRQRVMIAMAMSNSPALVIADEPTTALDVTTQVQVLRTLEEARVAVDAAMILITHDLGVIADVADRVAVMYNGRLIEVGPTSQVLDDPRHPYTAGLLRSRPRLDTDRGALRSIPGIPPRITATFPGCAFQPRCPRAADHAECTAIAPELVPVALDHLAACFLAGPAGPEEGASIARPPVPESHAAAERQAVEVVPEAVRASAAALDVRDLVKVYPLGRGRKAPTLTAVDQLNFILQPGRTLALVGESGCGKTTAARSVLRLVEPTSGTVALGATDVLALGTRDLRRFRTRAQIVFQDSTTALNPRQTVGDLIAEPMEQQGLLQPADRRRRVDELLALVSLYPEHANRYPSELSGGQRQRVAIARCIGLEPDVLVLDEPVSALDVSIQAQVVQLLTDLQRRLGIGYLFISHDLSVVRQLADDIAVMYLGRVVESGPAHQILTDPQHPYTQLLVASVPGEGAIDQSAFETDSGVTNDVGGCRFADRCPLAEPACAGSIPLLVDIASKAPDDPTSAVQVACHRHDVARTRFREVSGQ